MPPYDIQNVSEYETFFGNFSKMFQILSENILGPPAPSWVAKIKIYEKYVLGAHWPIGFYWRRLLSVTYIYIHIYIFFFI